MLTRMHAAATFFVIGEWTRRYPQLIRAEARGAFEIDDHTETHPFMSLLPAAEQEARIVRAAAAIQRAGAPFPRSGARHTEPSMPPRSAILRALRMLIYRLVTLS